jgi:hypothetical protein
MILTIKRDVVYLFGSSVSQIDRDAFAQHSLNLCSASSVLAVLPNLSYSRAIVFYASQENLAKLLQHFDECAISAAIYGNLLIPCANDPAVRKLISAHILHGKYAEIDATNRTRVFPDYISSTFLFRDGPISFLEIAKLCSLWDAGPSANSSLEIDGKSYAPGQSGQDDRLEDALLLQRGFPDCRRILTRPLTLGKSGATVLKIHPVFEAAVYGNSTRPLYAKLDSLQRIKQEVENYETYVDTSIPFFMRPNLIRTRCVLAGQGYRRGLIVGNFVEHSEPIIQTVSRGSAGLPLHTLFDHAFRTWRLGSRIETSISLLASLAKIGLVKKSPIRQEYVPLARSFGLERTAEEITDMLELIPAAAHRVGAIHGDLHTDNLHVRGIEPVLLDFYSVDEGPLVYDLATLEVSVVFCGYNVANTELDDWKRLVDLLYDRSAFAHPPEPQIHGSALENLWIAVRQLRCIAPTLEVSGNDYPFAIAFCLLRNATHKRESAFRTAYGLATAERLISQLAGPKDTLVK